MTHRKPTTAPLLALGRLGMVRLLAAVLLSLSLAAAAEDAAPGPNAAADRQGQAALLVARGRQLMARNQYRAAVEALQEAARLAPSNTTLERLLARARAAARSGAGAELGQAVAEQQAARSRSILRQIEHSLFDAEKALDATSYDRARQHARRALAALQYVTSAEHSRKLKARAERILATATKRLDQQRRGQQRRELERARAQAHRPTTPPAEADGLQALRRQARRLQVAGDHQKAAAAAEDILRIKPDDDRAQAIQARALDAASGPDDLGGRSATRARREDDFLASLEEEATPPPSGAVVLSDPDRAAPPRTKGLDSEPQEPWERELRARLAEEVTVDFQATPLSECVDQLAALGKINVVLDPEAAQDTPVTTGRTRMPLEALFRWIARFADLQYCIRDGAVLLTTGQGALDEPVRRVYDISPLVAPEDNAVPTAVIDATLGMAGPLEPRSPRRAEPKPEEVDVEALGEGWVAFLRQSVAPETWDGDRTRQEAGPQYSIQYRNGRIVVVHTPDVHRQIEDLLNSFRRARNLQVHILGRFLRVEDTFLERLTLAELNWTGPDASGPGEDPTGGKRYAFTPVSIENNTDVIRTVSDPIDPGAPAIERPLSRFTDISAVGGLELSWDYIGVFGHTADALINAVLKEQKGTVLQAPRLTCFNTQRANIQVLVNHNYVRSISADEEPEIGNVPEGIIFDVQPFVSADRRYITLVLQPQQRELLSLVAFSYSTGAIEVAEGLAVLQGSVIQIPTTRMRSLATTVTIPNGGTLVVGGFTEVEERSGQAGVPFLETVPLVGKVLRGFDTAEGRRSLLMMFTAETVQDIFEE